MPVPLRLSRLVTALTCGVVLAAGAAACGSVPSSAEEPASGANAQQAPVALRAAAPGLRSVMWVGNNWDGTASIVDAHTYEVLQRGIDLIPDKDEEIQRIFGDPVSTVFYLAVNAGPGQGHDQYVDDMFTTMDGKYLAVSRPSFADVVWIDIAKALAGAPDPIVREQQMDGYRTDHMQVSNDGSRLLVSDSTARQVIEYSMVDETLPDGTEIALGDRLRTFESGETPHESNYTEDGERILHASIGRVYLPGDDLDPADGTLLGLPLPDLGLDGLGLADLLDELPWEALDGLVKSDRWLQYVDAETFEVLERWDIAHELEEAGHPGMSSAVRPVAVHPNGHVLYLQVSFLHGYVVFDTEAADLNEQIDYTLGELPEPATGAVIDVVNLEKRTTLPVEAYVNDSAHHGIAISADGSTLCVAGTMDDYAALVDAETGEATYFDETTTGHSYAKPYWSTEGLDDTCWVSLSDADAVAVLSTRTGEELAYLPVGNHPQRVRHGYVPAAVVPDGGAPTGPADATCTAAPVAPAADEVERTGKRPSFKRLARTGVVRFTLPVDDAAVRTTLTLRANARQAAALGLPSRRTVLGTGSVTTSAAGTSPTVRVGLTAAARKALRRLATSGKQSTRTALKVGLRNDCGSDTTRVPLVLRK